MKNRGWFAVVSIFFLSLFVGVTLAQGQDRHDHFDDHDRQVARDWYHTHPDAFRHDEGVYWHSEWEPNIREGFVLTPDMRAGIRPVPHDLYVTLAPPPRHYRYVIIGDHVVLVDNGYRIHDVLHFELNF
jgi:hypothetical protein